MASVNLFGLYCGKIFRIPDYQRGYAWLEKQLEELWDDLEEISIENNKYKHHYTGTIYIEETQPDENENWLSGTKFYYVVDGQQRLTTISIFLFELLKFGKHGFCGESKEDLIKTYIRKTNSTNNSTLYKFSYIKSDNKYTFLLSNIFEDEKQIFENQNVNLYTKNLSVAKKFFCEKLQLLTHDQLEILFKKLTNSLLFDIRTIEKDLDVQAVFETMNNRGKGLTTLEKLKNRLIYLTERLKAINPEDRLNLRKKINDAWGIIYNCLAQNPDCILDEDIFLSAHLSLYRKPKEATFSEKMAEEKLFQMFCNRAETFDKDDSGKEEPVNFIKIEDYILKLSASAPSWYCIHNSNNSIINKILLLNGGKEIKVFLLALLLQGKNEKITQLFAKIEKILFRNRIYGLGVMDERTLASWGRDIYLDEDTIDGLEVKMDAIIQTPISSDNFIQQFNNLYTYERGPKGFHRWPALKYFLFEYEEYLKKRFQETNDKVDLSEFEFTTIEHIVPQQFRDNWSELVDDFTKGIEENEIENGRKVLINTLGNLTILKDGKNSSLGNKSWEFKRKRFATGSYNEIDISQNEQWTHKEILKRGIDMLQFLEQKVDGLKLSDDEKIKLLFYKDYLINKIEHSA